MVKRTSTRTTIGWREWIGLPDLGVAAINAKVDTGARSSSIHAFDVEEFEQDGARMVRFTLHPIQRRAHPSVDCEAPLLEYRMVKNPGGRQEQRPVITTRVSMGSDVLPIELTLDRRDTMGFRMLLGRQAIRGRYVVDPGRSFLLVPQAKTTQVKKTQVKKTRAKGTRVKKTQVKKTQVKRKGRKDP